MLPGTEDPKPEPNKLTNNDSMYKKVGNNRLPPKTRNNYNKLFEDLKLHTTELV